MGLSAGTNARPRVLVLGGGFAGIGAARKLKDADVEVVLVDKHDYHTFQPLLYQLATGLLETTAVGHSLRDLVKDQENATIHKAPVTGIDLEAKEVGFESLEPLAYDHLVLALGAEVNFFGTEGAAEHAFPMYTLSDAVRLKNHVLERWEAADKDSALVDDGALTAVVVGGGPTGVETAGALAELYRDNFDKDYPNLPQESACIVLVEAGEEIFAMFKPNLARTPVMRSRSGRSRSRPARGCDPSRPPASRSPRARSFPRTPSSGAPGSRARASSSRWASSSSVATG